MVTNMTKLMYRLLIACLVLMAPTAWANEEALIQAVEYDRLIVNWQPNAQRLAAVLAYECNTCAPKRLKVNADTILQNEEGQYLAIEHLKSKVDWAGTVQTLSDNPTAIIKIMLQ